MLFPLKLSIVILAYLNKPQHSLLHHRSLSNTHWRRITSDSFSNMGNIMKVMGNHRIPFLPYDIIINILKRLPVKSLIQFQCVCKDWKNIINSPSFIRDHLSHISHPTALLILKPSFKSSFRFQLLDRQSMQGLEIQKPPLIDSYFDLRIMGSCNGLLCLQVINENNAMSHRSKNHDVSPPYLLLWNPATRQFRKIPIEDFRVGYVIGFGFTPIDNDYKIAIIRCYFAINPVEVEVYSLNSGSWKVVEFENLEGTISINSFGNVNLNGVFYGLGGEQSLSIHRDHDMVVSIDLTKHVFTSIPLPDLGSKKSRRVKLMLYENKLAVVAVTISSFVHLWVMEEDTCASRGRWIWTKKYTCSFCAMRFWAERSPIEFVPMTIWKNEIVFLPFSIIGDDDEERRFCLLNLSTSEFKKFSIKCGPGIVKGDFNYVESLVSVGKINNKEP